MVLNITQNTYKKYINSGVLGNYTTGHTFNMTLKILSTKINSYALKSGYVQCKLLDTVDFPNLSIVDEEGLYECFQRSDFLQTIFFPNLTTIGSYGLYSCFNGCSSLSNAFNKF